MAETVTGYLLTRGWRDVPAGLELSFWGATEDGPVRLVYERQEAVCFLPRSDEVALPRGARRETRDLTLLGGGPVDVLYFRHQRDLQSLRQSGTVLAESDVRPPDRHLMERFVHAAF